MSLINDALRQASLDHREKAAAAAAPTAHSAPQPPVVQYVEPRPPSPWPALLRMGGVIVLALGVIGLGGFFLWKLWLGRQPAPVANSPSAPRQINSSIAPAPPVPAVTALPAKATTTNQPPAATAIVVPGTNTSASAPSFLSSATSAPPATNISAPRVVVPVNWPPLRLQALFYKPPDSSVIINGKVLFLDDEIQGVKVAEIGSALVKITLAGQTNTLMFR